MSHNEMKPSNASSAPWTYPDQIQPQRLSEPSSTRQDTPAEYPIPQNSSTRRPRRIFSLVREFEGLHNLSFQRKGVQPAQRENVTGGGDPPRFGGGSGGRKIKRFSGIFSPAKKHLESPEKITSNKSSGLERGETGTMDDNIVKQASVETLGTSRARPTFGNGEFPKAFILASGDLVIEETRRHTSISGNIESYNGEISMRNKSETNNIKEREITPTSLPDPKSGCDEYCPLNCKTCSPDPINWDISSAHAHDSVHKIHDSACDEALIQHFSTQAPRAHVLTRATALVSGAEATQRSGRVASMSNDVHFRGGFGSRNRIRPGSERTWMTNEIEEIIPVWEPQSQPLATSGRQTLSNPSERQHKDSLELLRRRAAGSYQEVKTTRRGRDHDNVTGTTKMIEDRRKVEPRNLQLQANNSSAIPMIPTRVSSIQNKAMIEYQPLRAPLAPPDAQLLICREASPIPSESGLAEIPKPQGYRPVNNFNNIQGMTSALGFGAESAQQGENIIITDRISTFEDTGPREENLKPNNRNSYSLCKMKNSMSVGNNRFKMPTGTTSEVYPHAPERALRKDDKQDERNGMKDDLSRDILSKNGTWRPKLSLDRMAETVKSRSRPHGNIDSPVPRAKRGMIVKRAQCGLKQPKPVRIVERRSIVALCEDEAWYHADEDNMRVGQRSSEIGDNSLITVVG